MSDAQEQWNWPRTVAIAAWPVALLASVVVLAVTHYSPFSPPGLAPAPAPAQQYAAPPGAAALPPGYDPNVIAAYMALQQQRTAAVTPPAPQLPQPAAPAAQPIQPIQPLQGNTSAAPTRFSIDNPELAGTVLATIGKLEGFEDKAGGANGGDALKTVHVFFDPRCPYCHKAWEAMKGKIHAHWNPVVVLSDPEGGKGMVRSLFRASDKAAQMDKFVARATLTAEETAADPGYDQKHLENVETFAALFKAMPGAQVAVPLFLIPRPDGKVVVMQGFETGDEKTIQAYLNGAQ